MVEENQKPNEVPRTAKEALERAESGERYDFSSGEKNEIREKELSREEQMVREEISREIKMMEQDENLRKESETKVKQIQVLGDEEKLDHLLQIAKQRGVAYAVKIAQKMGDPYILDTFHDILVKEGLWKTFKE